MRARSDVSHLGTYLARFPARLLTMLSMLISFMPFSIGVLLCGVGYGCLGFIVRC
jgi:hypothetical protein